MNKSSNSYRNYFYALKSYFRTVYGKFINKFHLIKPGRKVRKKETIILSKEECSRLMEVLPKQFKLLFGM